MRAAANIHYNKSSTLSHTYETNYLWCIVCAFRIASILFRCFAPFFRLAVFLFGAHFCQAIAMLLKYVFSSFRRFRFSFVSIWMAFPRVDNTFEWVAANVLLVDLCAQMVDHSLHLYTFTREIVREYFHSGGGGDDGDGRQAADEVRRITFAHSGKENKPFK